MNELCIFDKDYQRYVFIADHSRNYKSIFSMINPQQMGYWSRIKEEKIIVQNWKKGKLKTKELSKITILNEREPSAQSADRTKALQAWKWVEEIYSSKSGNWPSRYLYLKINTGCHARGYSSKKAIPERSQIRELH